MIAGPGPPLSPQSQILITGHDDTLLKHQFGMLLSETSMSSIQWYGPIGQQLETRLQGGSAGALASFAIGTLFMILASLGHFMWKFELFHCVQK